MVMTIRNPGSYKGEGVKKSEDFANGWPLYTIQLKIDFRRATTKDEIPIKLLFADIELSHSYLIVCNFLILIGLAFTSTFIELLRRQYNESWCKIQELRAQIQMQIKLAATMRQLAANNVDLEGMGMDLVRVHIHRSLLRLSSISLPLFFYRERHSYNLSNEQ